MGFQKVDKNILHFEKRMIHFFKDDLFKLKVIIIVQVLRLMRIKFLFK